MRITLAAALIALLGTLPHHARAVPCASNKTLADYIALGAGGCTLGDKVFSSFTLSLGPNAGATTVPTAAQIAVTPLNEPRNPGFRFTGNPPFQSPPAPSPPNPFFFSYRLGFTVTVQPGGALIDDASLEDAGATATGNANSSANELLCIGGAFQSKGVCNPGVPMASLDVRDNTGQPNQTFDSVTFGSIDVVDTQTLLVVQQGTPDQPGSAQVASLTEQFSEVPEPASALMLSGGLFGLLLSGRRRVA